MMLTSIQITLLALTVFLFVACALVYKLQQKYLALVQLLFGRTGLLVVSFFFVPVHELSHYLMAKLCGHRVTDVGFFAPNNTGTLGYVNHAYRRTVLSPFTNMFIGLAPILGFGLVVFALTKTLSLQDTLSFPSPSEHHFVLWSHYTLIHPLTYSLSFISANSQAVSFYALILVILNFLMFSIPSKADFTGASSGIAMSVALFVSLLVFEVFSFKVMDFLIHTFSFSLMVILTVITYQIAILLFLYLFSKLKSSVPSKTKPSA